MASDGQSTAFRQFNFCSLCKLSHKLGKKHIYSKRHQQILQAILKKFFDKIQKVKKDLFSPVVQNGDFERDAKFWCYFCKEEYLKHENVENFTVFGAGLLEHISITDHRSNMDQFFWDNLLKKELKPKYVLSQEDLYIFKKAAFLATKKKQKSEEMARKEVADRISFLERKRLSESAVTATSLNDLPGGNNVFRQENRCQSAIGRKKTVSARADGLTSIRQLKGGILKSHNPSVCMYYGLKDFKTTWHKYLAHTDGVTLKDVSLDTEDGNVHSGAVPPWLQSDADGSHSSVIGPTMQDFQKHLEREKKSKLPANRVGAKFDHTASTSHDWLPSFGRVWSKGRRLQSKQHFEKQLKKEGFGKFKQKPCTVSSMSAISATNTSWQSEDQQHLNTDPSNRYRSSQIHKKDKSNWLKADNSAKHISSSCTRLWDEGRNHQVDEVKSVPNVTVDSERPIKCNPYKRKNDVNLSVGSLQSNQRWSHSAVTNQCIIYKRSRDQTNRSVDQMKLLPTPVLAIDESK